MKRSIKILTIIILVTAVYSLVPVAVLYLRSDPAPYTNQQATEKLKGNKGEHFEFIVLGDNHAGLIFNDSAALKLAHSINREDRFKKVPVDFAVISGDITNRGSKWDYRIFNKVRASIRRPVMCAIGNHDDNDDRGEDTTYFEKYAGKKEFSFADRNSYFIVINTSSGEVTDPQFSWLEEELKKSSAYQHRFIICHKPPISPYQQSWYRPEVDPWAYRFMKLCEKYKVDIVFSGHEHMFKEMSFGGVKYIVSGGGGMLIQFPDRDGGFLHYVAVRVYGDYVDYEVRKICPPLWEFLLYYLWKDAFYILKCVY